MIPEGYKMNYTWVIDFKIANTFGENSVKDTYNRAFKEWKDNVVAMKELTFCLNSMSWEFYYSGNENMMKLYANLYQECYDKCLDHFKGDELHEYLEFLD